jgi:hypothetical protein
MKIMRRNVSALLKADDPKQHALMLKLASAWREDAEALRRVAEGTPSDAPAPAPLRRNKR